MRDGHDVSGNRLWLCKTQSKAEALKILAEAAALAQLTPREREVIDLRFGLYDDPKSLEEVGELYGETAARIEAIEKSALNKLGRVLPASSGPNAPGPPDKPARAMGLPRDPFFADYRKSKRSD
jgi:hypothetical protein